MIKAHPLAEAQAHLKAGRFDAAAHAARAAVKAAPSQLEPWLLLAEAETEQNRFAEANQAYLEALRINSSDARVFRGCGHMLRRAGKWDEARMMLERAVELAPQDAVSWRILGQTLRDCGAIDLALDPLARAAQLAPQDPACWLSLGLGLQLKGILSEAEKAYDRAEAFQANAATLANHRSLLHLRQGRLQDAIACARDAVKFSPQDASHHFNLGGMLLLAGETAEGWREYAWRMGLDEAAAFRPVPGIPVWDGSALAGKAILLTFEQGLGDGIHFIRYARAVKARGGRIFARMPAPLIPLLSAMPELDGVIASDDPLPGVDMQAALLDLPRLLGPEVGHSAEPYLVADEARRRRWRSRFADLPGLKVGLVWAGNPIHENDRNRSINLSALAPLFDIPGVSFVSLQMGIAADEIAARGLQKRIFSAAPLIANFADTAAALAELDLVISVDTAVVHCAGALGRPCWMLLPTPPDWRWGWSGETTPWYPSLRIFRQPRHQNWTQPLESLRRALVEEVARRAPAPSPAQAGMPLNLLTDKIYARALAAYRKGDWAETEEALATLLQGGSPNASAEGLLGAVRQNQGRHEDAVEIFERLALREGDAKHWSNLGVALQKAGNEDIALSVYDEALRRDPLLYAARRNRAELRLQRGDHEGARSDYEVVRTEKPDDPWLLSSPARTAADPLPPLAALVRTARCAIDRRLPAAAQLALDIRRSEGRQDLTWLRTALDLANLRQDFRLIGPLLQTAAATARTPEIPRLFVGALILHQKLGEAIEACQALLARFPDDSELLRSLAQAFNTADRKSEAIETLERLCRIDPHPEWNANLSHLLRDAKRFPEAYNAARTALALAPDNLAALLAMAAAAADAKAWNEGLAAAEKAWAQRPGDADVLALILSNLRGRDGEAAALARLESIIERDQGNPALWRIKGLIQKDQNNFVGAIAATEQAMALGLSDTHSLVNFALMHLTIGEYEKGWGLYEKRWNLPILQKKWPPLASRPWDGGDPKGKTILIVGEQGFGDCIQMVRYARELEGRGARVITLMAPPLKRLFQKAAGVSISLMPGDAFPPYDAHVAAFSLPRLFNTRLDHMPSADPYLAPDLADVTRVGQIITQATRPDTRIKAGIVWAGNPAHAMDTLRSLNLAALTAALEIPGLQLFSLQKDRNEALLQNASLSAQIVNLGPVLNDFADTAAALANLDLLISADTSVVHLAGAMGRPVLMLCPFTPDWRWGLKGETSPWYPSVRIVRQDRRGDWTGPLAALRAALVA